ncbi:MAG: Fe-S cluster assembly protein SufD [Cyanobacteria bacterium P01_E01_bin.45]
MTTSKFSKSQADGQAIATNGSVDRYLANLIAQREAVAPATDLLAPLRADAAERASLMSLPTMRDEDWRFTNLSSLKDVQFAPADTGLTVVETNALDIPEASATRLVFVNGQFSADLSDLSGVPDGVTVGNLASLSAEHQQAIVERTSVDAMGQGDTFTLLNSTCMTDMAVVWVSKNAVVDTPIQIAFVSVSGSVPTVSHPRCAIVAERGSAVTVVEQFFGSGDSAYLTNTVTEIVLDNNAQLEHCKWQAEADNSFHVARTAISQAKDSRYTGHTISTGGQLSRHSLETVQQGVNVRTTLNGLTIASNSQISDTHTAIDHANPHGGSNQVHKCIVGDRAHTIFNGKVLVRPDAQKIDSSQSSRNLLLSNKARVDTKPQLEIFADDVKCAHGATVSQLVPDEVFYLRSRGLSKARAKQLLTYAFAAEAIDKISVKSVADRLKAFAMTHSSFE